MRRTCGDRPAASAFPLLDAEAVLLVDDGDRKVGERDVALDSTWVPTAIWATPLAIRRESSWPRPAGQEYAADAELRAQRLDVRKCCSASVSVGAISAPCRALSTARSSA